MKNASINHADAKINKTVFANMGDIHTKLAEAGATPDEVKAMSAVFTGESIANAANENGLAVEGETTANTVNRIRNRFCTIMLNGYRAICEPVANIVSAEKAEASEAERQEKLAQQLADWEANGGRGRKPGEGNRPKHEIAIEKAHADARRDARKELGIPAQGRITPDMQEKYVREFKALYGKALKAIAKEHSETITLDADKIEKMVNKGIKELRVSAAAQKAVKPKNQKAKAKNAKGKKGATATETETETEDTTAEVPSTETADEKVEA